MRRRAGVVLAAVTVLSAVLVGGLAPAAQALPKADVCHGIAEELDEAGHPTGYIWTNCGGKWVRMPG